MYENIAKNFGEHITEEVGGLNRSEYIYLGDHLIKKHDEGTITQADIDMFNNYIYLKEMMIQCIDLSVCNNKYRSCSFDWPDNAEEKIISKVRNIVQDDSINRQTAVDFIRKVEHYRNIYMDIYVNKTIFEKSSTKFTVQILKDHFKFISGFKPLHVKYFLQDGNEINFKFGRLKYIGLRFSQNKKELLHPFQIKCTSELIFTDRNGQNCLVFEDLQDSIVNYNFAAASGDIITAYIIKDKVTSVHPELSRYFNIRIPACELTADKNSGKIIASDKANDFIIRDIFLDFTNLNSVAKYLTTETERNIVELCSEI
jgi:hypothetical protein